MVVVLRLRLLRQLRQRLQKSLEVRHIFSDTRYIKKHGRFFCFRAADSHHQVLPGGSGRGCGHGDHPHEDP